MHRSTRKTPPAPDSRRRPHSALAQCLSVLLVEDDRADALLVEELIADAVYRYHAWSGRSRWPTLNANFHAPARIACCWISTFLTPRASMLSTASASGMPAIPIVVLTGLNDEHFGISAVASGAQDYLVKGRVEPENAAARAALCDRAQAGRAHRRRICTRASSGRGENARLERGLLPSPLLLDDPGVDIVTQYRPSRENALLGGDFYDVGANAGRDRPRHDRRRRRARTGRGRPWGRIANRLAGTDLRRASWQSSACGSSNGSCRRTRRARRSSRRC